MSDKDLGWVGRLFNYSILFTALQTGCWAGHSTKHPPKLSEYNYDDYTEALTDNFLHPFPGNLEETILTQAKQNQVILFGEEHRMSLDNCFVGDLLEKLQQQGYQHLMVELPKMYQNTVEQFLDGKIEKGELFEAIELQIDDDFLYLLTQAKKAGMAVHCMDSDNLDYRIRTERDKEMARNIEILLDKEPQTKIAVFVGGMHGLKGNYKRYPEEGNNLLEDGCRLGCRLVEITRGKSYSVLLNRYVAVNQKYQEGRDFDLIANPPKSYFYLGTHCR